MQLPVTSLLLACLLAGSAFADSGNVLLSMDTLTTERSLTVPGATFIIQDDCNLVLYNGGPGFQSNTHGAGRDCYLVLEGTGQLVVKSPASNSEVWRSPNPKGPYGSYAAVLRPDGQVGIYGPAVWSTPPPHLPNVLYSSQVLYTGGKVATRDSYTLVMRDDCNLVLLKASVGVTWESNTSRKAHNCFATLDNKGQMAVLSNKGEQLWVSKGQGKEGEYVLVVQDNGQAVIYGPRVWSTAKTSGLRTLREGDPDERSEGNDLVPAANASIVAGGRGAETAATHS